MLFSVISLSLANCLVYFSSPGAAAVVPRDLFATNGTATNGTISNSTTGTAPQATIYPSTSNGSAVVISGVSQSGVDIYYGIPYAKPPLDELRFVPPQPAMYNTTLTAQTPGPACLQIKSPGLSLTGSNFTVSEDCLTLNVYTPAGAETQANASLPVMVWFYGGSFETGSASTYVGTPLVAYGTLTDRPVVYVSFNYRLGIWGWGYGEEMAANGAANIGLKDQIAALQWVKDNIWAFGGDASKVTIFGESAGAISISLLFLNESIDLFRGAIMESGAPSTAPVGPTASTWQTPYDVLANYSGCASPNATAAGNESSFDCLKALPATALLNASAELKSQIQYALPFLWGPSIDGDLIPDSPFTLLEEGKFARIPFITGNNKDEGTAFVSTALNSTQAVAAYIDFFLPTPLNTSTMLEVLAVYPDIPALGSPFDTGNDTFGLPTQFKQTAAIFGDAAFQSRRRDFIRKANQNGFNQTWTYQFEGQTPSLPAYFGITHGTEILYVFGFATPALNYTASEQGLSMAMMNYWINFATYLDPNGPTSSSNTSAIAATASSNSTASNSTYWAPHTYPANKNLIQLVDQNVTVIQDDYREDQMSFFNTIPKALFYRR